MLLGGKKLSSIHEEIVVFPRGEEPDLVFKFRPIKDHEEFNKLWPEPKPPSILYPGETDSKPDFTDEGYKKAVIDFNTKFALYLLIKSILATPELQFETVKIEDPTTWGNINTEFAEAGLNQIEINRLYEAALTVNSLNDAAIEKAKERFLASRRQPK